MYYSGSRQHHLPSLYVDYDEICRLLNQIAQAFRDFCAFNYASGTGQEARSVSNPDYQQTSMESHS